MNPITASIDSRHGAEDVDDQFDDIEFDTVASDHSEQAPVTTPAAETPEANQDEKARKSPHIVPKIAPPKAVKRYQTGELPETGTWIVVTIHDGKRKETFQGRVAIAEPDRLRLRQGAGWWEIPMRTVHSIAAGEDPARRRS